MFLEQRITTAEDATEETTMYAERKITAEDAVIEETM
jgi:hypothetical protein